jgi:preprotein translocase subunit SecA
MFGLFGFAGEWSEEEKKDLDSAGLAELILAALNDHYAKREQEIGTANMRHLERVVLLQVVDHHWKEHLLNMDHLKEGIGLRGYGQKNPLDEYKKEGFNMFGEMIATMKNQTVSTLFRLQLVRDEEVAELEREQREQRQPMQLKHGEEEENQHTPFSREGDKVGRNSDCPCGSGQKYKRCCGKSSGKK